MIIGKCSSDPIFPTLPVHAGVDGVGLHVDLAATGADGAGGVAVDGLAGDVLAFVHLGVGGAGGQEHSSKEGDERERFHCAGGLIWMEMFI